jgi:hypothetical protein
MTIEENTSFKSVEKYDTLVLKDTLELLHTEHLQSSRRERLDKALEESDEDDYIEHTFLVDKGHPAGKELHNVTHSGLILILNEQKYKDKVPCFITVLLARINQIKRLYDPFGFKMDDFTVKKCKHYVESNLNN